MKSLAPLLSLCFSMLSLRSAAQEPFIQVFTGDAYAVDVIELSSGNLLTGIAPHSSSRHCTVLLDNSCNVLHEASASPIAGASGGWNATRYLAKASDNDIRFATSLNSDTCTVLNGVLYRRTYPALGRMDSLGAISSLHRFRINAPSCYAYPTGIEALADEAAILFGEISGSQGAFTLKADTLGQVIWAKRFPEARSIAFLKELPNGDLLAGFNFDTSGTAVARMDADGNPLWIRSLFRPRGRISDALVKDDGSFLVGGITDRNPITGEPPPPGMDPRFFVAALDANGSLIYARDFGSAPGHWLKVRFAPALDGGSFVLTNSLLARLHRLNPVGDVQWSRAYEPLAFGYYDPRIISTGDRGVLIHGSVGGFFPVMFPGFYLSGTGTCLLKVDSLGHAPCFDYPYDLVVTELAAPDSIVSLTSTNGAISTAVTTEPISCSWFEQYDGCLFTGVPDATSNQITIHPNPSTGRFTISIRDPMVSASTFAVFDALGHSLIQELLPAGATLMEIDLSRHGKGVYMIRRTATDGLQHARVIVE